jgi:DNA-binding beta-propeller fold protein YncE
MKTHRRLIGLLVIVSIAAGLSLFLAGLTAASNAASQVAPQATVINLSITTSPPTAVRPGQSERFQWQITPASTPVSVSFSIYDVDNGVLLMQEIYPGTSGLAVTQFYTLPITYTLPFGKPFERYLGRVQYFSDEVGYEAGAEAIFWVTQDTGDIQVIKFNDRDGQGTRDPGDEGVENVRFGLAIQGQTLYRRTNPAGEILWGDVPIGTYTVTEDVPAGYVATTSTVLTAEVKADATAVLTFGNRLIPGALAALVWVDTNGDGRQDSGEAPYPGASVGFSSPCGDDQNGVTGLAGTILWSNRCVGAYTVGLTVPVGYAATTPISVSAPITSSVTTTVTFGIQGRGSLVGCKYEDRNGNGQPDAGEPAVGGVQMAYQGPLDNTGSAKTDANGCVVWSNLLIGNYIVLEQAPSGCTVTTDPYPATAAVTAGSAITTTIGNRCFGALRARVFEDSDGDGAWGTLEAPLAGVTVAWTNEYGDNASALTPPTGTLTWADQPAGIYTVTQTILPGYQATTPSTRTVTVTVNAITTVDFGQRPDTACVEGHKIDDEHVGLPGWIIRARLADGTGPQFEAITDGTGHFRFAALPLGVYRFWEIQQPGWSPVTVPEFEVPVLEPGEECLRVRFKNRQAESPPDGVSSYLPLVMAPGVPGGGVARAAELRSLPTATPTPTPTGAGCVVGRKIDVLQAGLPGFVLQLAPKAGGAARTATTNGLGDFRFDGVPPGQYTISEAPTLGWIPVGADRFDISVAAGSACTRVQFENRQATPTPTFTPTPTPTHTPTPRPVLGCIFGQKVDDVHVGLPGWTIHAQLASGAGPIYTDVTDGTGAYRFEDLPLGVYRVWEEMQTGWAPVTLPSFEVTLRNSDCVQTRFKNRQITPTLGCIDGHKVDDLHVGLPGWTIKAQRADGTGPTYTDVTDGTGYYRFDDLPFGTWRLWEEMQSGWNPVTLPSFEVTLDQSTSCVATRFKNRQAGVPPTPEPVIEIPYPKGIAVNSQSNQVFVGSKATGQLYKVDGVTNAVLASWLSGQEPFGVAVSRVTGKVYVANFAGDTLAIFDGASGARLATIDFAALGYGEPSYVAVDETLNRAYVTLHQGGRLAVIDGATNALVTTVETGGGSFGLALHPGLHRAYVSNRDTDTVTIVDTATNTRLWAQAFLPGGTPYALAVDATRDRLYVLYALHGNFPDRVGVFSVSAGGAGPVRTVLVDDGGSEGGTGIAVNPTTGHVFVANSAAGTVSVLGGPGPAVIATLGVGGDPGMIGVNPATNRVYVSNRSLGVVQIVSDGALLARLGR